MKKFVLSASALLFITSPALAADFFSTENPALWGNGENTEETSTVGVPVSTNNLESTETSSSSETEAELQEKQRNRRQEYMKKIRERYLAKNSERNTVANKEVREYENSQESWEKRRYIRSTEVRGTTQRKYGNDYYSYAQKKWDSLAKDNSQEETEEEYVYQNYKDESALKRRVRKLTDKTKWQDEMQDHFRTRYGRYNPTQVTNQ